MKLRLAFGVISVLLFAGCNGRGADDEPTCENSVGIVNWVYKNSTDRDIKIESFYKNIDMKDYKMDLSFSIPAGGEYVKVDGMLFGSFTTPFQWEISSPDIYPIISNGLNQITQKYYAKESKGRTLYKVMLEPILMMNFIIPNTFTDEDFRNAKPIER